MLFEEITYPPKLLLFNKCRNPSLGLATKARACNVVGQKGSPGVKESVRE
jgi:hypothetical protein